MENKEFVFDATTADQLSCRRMILSTGSMQSELFLGSSLLTCFSQLMTRYRAVQVLLFTDTIVAPFYVDALYDQLFQQGWRVQKIIVDAGEQGKSIDNLMKLYDALYSLGVERDDVIVSVGGGAVSDIAGVVAGTYLRGLPFVQVPTTLIAMMTASIGGKVGVNFRGNKNLIGLFNAPQMIIADLDVLSTLPQRERLSGLGELITVGVLGAPLIFVALEKDPQTALEPLLVAAIECKQKIVLADPYDRNGIRAKLNLGHTFGHALETLSNFTLPHGLAVAVGLHIACCLSSRLGLCPAHLVVRVRNALARLHLPIALQGYQVESMIETMRNDKKRQGGKIHFILPIALGEVTMISEHEVNPEMLREVLDMLVYRGEVAI